MAARQPNRRVPSHKRRSCPARMTSSVPCGRNAKSSWMPPSRPAMIVTQIAPAVLSPHAACAPSSQRRLSLPAKATSLRCARMAAITGEELCVHKPQKPARNRINRDHRMHRHASASISSSLTASLRKNRVIRISPARVAPGRRSANRQSTSTSRDRDDKRTELCVADYLVASGRKSSGSHKQPARSRRSINS